MALPMTPSDYRLAFDGIAKAAEYHAIQRKLDAGHEFAGLMSAGGSLFIQGEWREIVTTISEPNDRVTIVCTDCAEWLAARTATRSYRPPSTEGES